LDIFLVVSGLSERQITLISYLHPTTTTTTMTRLLSLAGR
jgi:hypothetical protein